MSTLLVPVRPEEVRRVWAEADQDKAENSLGIFDAFAPLVQWWLKFELTAEELERLYLIGGSREDKWGRSSRGTFRVRSCDLPPGAGMKEPNAWALVAIEDPETKGRVLIDGNTRAVLLWQRLRAGQSIPVEAVLYVGELRAAARTADGFVATALSSLGRPAS